MFLFCLFLLLACQKPSSVSVSAAPDMASLDVLETRITLLKDLMAGTRKLDEKNPHAKALIQIIPKEWLEKPILDPNKRLLLVGEVYFHEHQFIKASFVLSQLLDQAPLYPRARNLLARCFYFLGNPKRAFLELEYVIVHQNQDIEEVLDALFLSGAIVQESKLEDPVWIQKGIDAFKTYLSLAPKSPHAKHAQMGLKWLLEQKKPTKNKLKINSIYEQAFTAFEQKNFLQSEILVQKNLRSDPKNPTLNTLLARIWLQTKRQKQAMELFNTILKQHPTHVPAWHYKGMAHILSQDPKQAIACWREVIKLDKNYAKRFNLESRIQMALALKNTN